MCVCVCDASIWEYQNGTLIGIGERFRCMSWHIRVCFYIRQKNYDGLFCVRVCRCQWYEKKKEVNWSSRFTVINKRHLCPTSTNSSMWKRKNRKNYIGNYYKKTEWPFIRIKSTKQLRYYKNRIYLNWWWYQIFSMKNCHCHNQ